MKRLLGAAKSHSPSDWHTLFLIGIYTGLRLGDCCLLEWKDVNLDRGIIQVIPRKTRKHSRGMPVTIPIHPALLEALRNRIGIPSDASNRTSGAPCESSVTPTPPSGYVLPAISDLYLHSHWQISYTLESIFKAAGIKTSVKIDGRVRATPEATFHSLRHTFVSLAANAGVPLPVIAAIVGHSSTAMTRHYYHESEAALRRAVTAVPRL